MRPGRGPTHRRIFLHSLCSAFEQSLTGRVRVWRGGLRFGLSVSAPFVWRCLTSRTITPFPHPPHRTGHAELPHPALGQDTHLRTRKVRHRPTDHRTGPCYPSVQPTGRTASNRQRHLLGGRSLPGADSGFFLRFGMWCLPRLPHRLGVPRVAPISRASPLSAPVLNQGPFPPPALPGFLSTTGLSATPSRPL
jgi:hypothetical protein